MKAIGLDRLIGRKVLFITGKGGIGKTLTVSALGMYAAAQGKKVCLIESTVQDQLAPLFGKPPIGHKLTQLDERLFAINLNAKDNFRDFVVKHLGHEGLFERVFNNTLVKSLLAMLPALAELTFLGRVYYTSHFPEAGNFDLVIVDGYSSGHFQTLMSTPAAVLNSGLVGPVITETKRITDYLSDREKCGVLFLTTLEPLVVSECVEFIPKIDQAGVTPVIGIGINRYLGDQEAVSADLRKLRATAADLRPVCDHILASYHAEDEEIAALKDSLKATPYGDLPLSLFYELGAVHEPLRPADVAALLRADGEVVS